MAQLVLGAAGAYIGFQLGGPQGAQLGFAAGAALGGAYATSRKRLEGPRLNDLKLTGTQYGEPIPWMINNARLPGQVWWASEKREIATTTSQGKGGGPKVTTFTYEQDVLLGLCEKEIVAVTRVWSFGKLVRNTLGAADVGTLATSDRTDLWRRLTVYTGSSTQLPDPTYEAAVGAGNAPGYRGRAYVFIEGLKLDSAGQLPLLTFEVIDAGTLALSAASYIGTEIPAAPVNTIASSIAIGNSSTFAVGIPQWDNTYSTTAVACYQWSLSDPAVYSPIGEFNVQTSGINPAGHGNADQPFLVLQESSTEVYLYAIPYGTTYGPYDVAESLGSTQVRFAQRGDYLVLGSAGSGSQAIRSFDWRASGSPLATSSALPDYVNSIEIIGDAVYCAGFDDRRVFVLDVATLTLQSTINRPSFGGSGNTNALLFASGGDLWLFENVSGSAALYRLDGASWTQISGTIDTAFLPSDNGHSIGIVGSVLLVGRIYVTSVSDREYRMWAAKIAHTPTTTTVQDAVEQACERSGLTSAEFDASALSSITTPFRGVAVAQVEGMRGVLEQMRTVYGFDCVLSDKLRFKPRGGSAVRTLSYADLAAGEGQPSEEPFALTVAPDLELPPQVAVKFVNAANDYQAGSELSDRLVVTSQVATQEVEFGISLIPSEAKRVADTLVAEGFARIAGATFAVDISNADLEPTDVVNVTAADGGTVRMRIERRTDAAGVLEFTAVRDDVASVSSSALTDDDYTQGSTVEAPSATLWRALDIPLLRDVDDGPGWVIAARGATSVWPGALVEQAWNGVDYTTAATVSESAVFGQCTTTLGDFTGVGVDERNTLTVSVGSGELVSSTRDAMLADASINTLLVGSEVIRFISASLSSADPNVYILSRLLRGQRGTESHKATHGANEACVLLRPQGLRHIASDAGDIGRERSVRATTLGASPSYVIAQPFTDTGLALKPFAPVDSSVTRDASDNATITWRRRSRLSGRLFAGGPPLGEDAEAYEVDIYEDNTFSTVVRTITASTSSATYTAAEQTADGLTAGDPLNFRAYQISTAYGRGYPLQMAEGTPASVVPSAGAWNLLDKGPDVTLSGGDLVATIVAAYSYVRGTTSHSNTGDWYFEVTVSGSSTRHLVGIALSSAPLTNYPGSDVNGYGYYGFNGELYNGGSLGAYGATYTDGDVIGVRLNSGTLTFYKNGVSQGPAAVGLTGNWFPIYGPGINTGTHVGTINAGSSSFGSLPSGSTAWG